VLLIPHLLFKKKKIPTSARWIKAVLRTKLKKKALPAHKLISAELLQTFLGKGDILKHKNSQTQLAIDSKINCKPTFRKPNFIKKY
jgi:alkylated DNA nucleotide flippase Atl1